MQQRIAPDRRARRPADGPRRRRRSEPHGWGAGREMHVSISPRRPDENAFAEDVGEDDSRRRMRLRLPSCRCSILPLPSGACCGISRQGGTIVLSNSHYLGIIMTSSSMAPSNFSVQPRQPRHLLKPSPQTFPVFFHCFFPHFFHQLGAKGAPSRSPSNILDTTFSFSGVLI